MGARRMLVLIDGLPPDSAVFRDGKVWTKHDEVTALIVERNELWLSVLAVVLGAKPDKLPPLIRIEHPQRVAADEKPKNVVRGPADLQRLKAASKKGR